MTPPAKPRLLTILVAFLLILGAASLPPRTDDDGPDRGEGGRLVVRLLPRLEPSRGIAVFLELEGGVAEGLKALSLAPEIAAMPKHLVARDDRGLLRFRRDVPGRIGFSRPVEGEHLEVSYFIESRDDRDHLDLRVDERGVWAVGYRLLALPATDTPLDVQLRWELRAVEVPAAATSLGVGRVVRTRAKPFDLAHAFYLAGPLAIHEHPAGHRLVSWGEPGFDPNEMLALCTEALDTASAIFDTREPEPHTFVFVNRPGMGTASRGLAFHRSFAAWLSPDRSIDERLRMLVAHEVVHRWIGSAVRLTADDGADAQWFSEGFSVHYARKVLRRASLVSEAALARDRTRGRSRRTGATRLRQARAPLAATARPSPSYGRGAAYAAELDERLASRGGLDPLIRALLARARREGPSLPVGAFRRAVVGALGPGAGAELDRLTAGAGAETASRR